MATGDAPASIAAIQCCPDLTPCATCDVIEFPYRLPFHPVVGAGDGQSRVVPVEVTFRYRLERCSGRLALGDLLYSTTLLPGEQVRLFTSDRHTRFTFDSESKLAYRNNTTSEESFFMSGMANAMSNLNTTDNRNLSQTFHESSVSGGGGGGIDLGFISFGGSAAASSHDAQSASAFAERVTQHADAYSHHVESGVRAASSTQVGEVASRTHVATESEDHFESASRVFSNPNHCRALSFLFYRVDKCQTLSWTLVAIDLRVDDPAAPTGIELNPAPITRGVAVIPDGVKATAQGRPDVARRALEAVAIERTPGATTAIGTVALAAASPFPTAALTPVPIALPVRQAALQQVRKELQAERIIDAAGHVTADAQKRLGWTRDLSLPTPGVVVKGCLDDCNICEPETEQRIQLELTKLDLENKLLQRKIDLMDKDQEHRCCPTDTDSVTPA